MICIWCHRPMQVLSVRYDGGILTSKTYGCFCRGTLYHVNQHTGDKTREEPIHEDDAGT